MTSNLTLKVTTGFERTELVEGILGQKPTNNWTKQFSVYNLNAKVFLSLLIDIDP